MKKIFLFLGLALLSVEALAVTIAQNNITISMVGTEFNGTKLMVAISPNTSDCAYSAIYFTTAAELNQVLSVALAAKMSNKQVRIIFDQETAGSFCTGKSIYIQ